MQPPGDQHVLGWQIDELEEGEENVDPAASATEMDLPADLLLGGTRPAASSFCHQALDSRRPQHSNRALQLVQVRPTCLVSSRLVEDSGSVDGC